MPRDDEEDGSPVRIEGASRVDLGSARSTLIERAKAGEQAAWNEIYEHCHKPVYRYVRARIWDEQAAEDVTADVFVAAVRGIGRYRQEGKPLLAWLFGIASHAVVDHQRQVGRRRRLTERLSRLADQLRSTADLNAATADQFVTPGGDEQLVLHLDLVQAVNRLTTSQREVMTLRYFVGLDTPEIAAVMGKRAAAVYSLHARALVTLRAMLAEAPGRRSARCWDEHRRERVTT